MMADDTTRPDDAAPPDIAPDAWAALDPATVQRRRLARARVVAHNKSHQAHISFDMLRTRVLRTMAQRNWHSLLVTSPTPGCGKTTTCLNLAFSLARSHDTRTIMVELDFVRPHIARMLDLSPQHSIADALSGDADLGRTLMRYGDTLAFGFATAQRGDSAELLQSARCLGILAEMTRRYAPDLVIYDLPPLFAVDDALGFAPHVDCALVVAAEGESTVEEVDDCVGQLSRVTSVLGVVMNKSVFREGGSYAYGRYGYGR